MEARKTHMTIEKEQEYFSKCRTNNLNDRKRFKGEDTKCRMCGCECEDLGHFFIVASCRLYNEERPKCRELQRPYIENEQEIVGKFLFKSDNIEK